MVKSDAQVIQFRNPNNNPLNPYFLKQSLKTWTYKWCMARGWSYNSLVKVVFPTPAIPMIVKTLKFDDHPVKPSNISSISFSRPTSLSYIMKKFVSRFQRSESPIRYKHKLKTPHLQYDLKITFRNVRQANHPMITDKHIKSPLWNGPLIVDEERSWQQC